MPADCSTQPELQALLRELGLPRLRVLARPEDIATDTAVPFLDAVRLAIEAFATDTRGGGNQYATVAFAIRDDPTAWGLSGQPDKEQIRSRLLRLLAEDATAKLVLLSDAVLTIEEYRFPPEQRESLTDNWVFRVIAPQEWGQLTWAIIDRTGAKPAYCYYHD